MERGGGRLGACLLRVTLPPLHIGHEHSYAHVCVPHVHLTDLPQAVAAAAVAVAIASGDIGGGAAAAAAAIVAAGGTSAEAARAAVAAVRAADVFEKTPGGQRAHWAMPASGGIRTLKKWVRERLQERREREAGAASPDRGWWRLKGDARLKVGEGEGGMEGGM